MSARAPRTIIPFNFLIAKQRTRAHAQILRIECNGQSNATQPFFHSISRGISQFHVIHHMRCITVNYTCNIATAASHIYLNAHGSCAAVCMWHGKWQGWTPSILSVLSNFRLPSRPYYRPASVILAPEALWCCQHRYGACNGRLCALCHYMPLNGRSFSISNGCIVHIQTRCWTGGGIIIIMKWKSNKKKNSNFEWYALAQHCRHLIYCDYVNQRVFTRFSSS